MAQDLRKLFEQERQREYRMKAGHEARFARRLEREHPMPRRKNFTFLLVAASLLLFMGLGAYIWLKAQATPISSPTVVEREERVGESQLSLGDLSPDLRKIEQYYIANINLQLSDLEVTDESKAMVDSFMERLAELNADYQTLNRELNTLGPNDQTINALINNLQLRLELLYKLKEKLETLKSSTYESTQTI